MGWQWHQLDYMQIICTSLQTDNHTSTAPLSFYRPDALPPAQPTASKHWRQCMTLLYCKKATSIMALSGSYFTVHHDRGSKNWNLTSTSTDTLYHFQWGCQWPTGRVLQAHAREWKNELQQPTTTISHTATDTDQWNEHDQIDTSVHRKYECTNYITVGTGTSQECCRPALESVTVEKEGKKQQLTTTVKCTSSSFYSRSPIHSHSQYQLLVLLPLIPFHVHYIWQPASAGASIN